jgi:hypothetical protein
MMPINSILNNDIGGLVDARKSGSRFFLCGWKNGANSLPLMFKFADGVHWETTEAVGLVCAMPDPRRHASN